MRQVKPSRWAGWSTLCMVIVVAWGVVTVGHSRLSPLWADGKARVKRAQLPDLIGISPVVREMGSKTPIGRQITVGQVEGQAGDYVPKTQGGRFRGVWIKARSGSSKPNGHATATGRLIYGRGGLAPGVSRVHCYTSRHWMTNGVLKAGTDLPPDPDGCRVFSHSWIGFPSNGSVNVVRRLDYLIDQRDVIAVAGVNNGAKSKVPALLGSSYNAIAVGVASGASSGGYTVFEGDGRCKPDLVAPHNVTSFSTPVVAAVAARLLEFGDRMEHTDTATRAEVIKSVLMAGADKPAGWEPQPGKPLDEHLGAGTVRFDQSLAILRGGPASPGEPVPMYGWDFRSVEPGQALAYSVELTEQAEEVSVMLVWHRRIDGRVVDNLLTGRRRWLDAPRLEDLDLAWVSFNAEGQSATVADSASDIDNVEHVYLMGLPAGRYGIRITRKDKLDEAWDVAVAWRMGPSRHPQEEASEGDNR